MIKTLLRLSIISLFIFSAPLCLAVAQNGSSIEEKIPDIRLSEELLFKILVSEVALQRGELIPAWELYMDLAKTTHDPRFARRALEVGLSIQQPEQALMGARLWHDISPKSRTAMQSLQMLLILQNRLIEFEEIAKKQLMHTPEAKRMALLLEFDARLTYSVDQRKVPTILETLIKLDKPRAETQLALARAYVRTGQFKLAQRALELALKLKPDFALAVLMLADMQRQSGQKEAAEELLQDFVKVEKNSRVANMQSMVQMAYQLLAQIAEGDRDFVKADKWLEKIDAADLRLIAQAQRARLLIKQGKVDEAKKLFIKLRQQPNLTAQQQRELSQVEINGWIEVKAYHQAVALLEEQLKLWPEDAESWYELAMIQEKLSQYKLMEQSLRQAIKYNPEMAHAYNALGYSMVERNEGLPEARALIEKALSFAPNDPYFLDSMGWIEYRQGNLHEAKKLLQYAFSIKSEIEIGIHLAEVLWRIGEQDNARDILRKIKVLDANNEILRNTLQRLLKPGESL